MSEIEQKTIHIKKTLQKYINKNLEEFIDSPKQTRYRNNVIFSIGYNKEGNIVSADIKSKICKEREYVVPPFSFASTFNAGSPPIVSKAWALLKNNIKIKNKKEETILLILSFIFFILLLTLRII